MTTDINYDNPSQKGEGNPNPSIINMNRKRKNNLNAQTPTPTHTEAGTGGARDKYKSKNKFKTRDTHTHAHAHAHAHARGRNKNNRLCKSTSHIAIIGTGPSALSCALSLQQAGFEHLVLYERDAHFHARKDGYGLTLTYNPSRTSSYAPLAQLGLLEDVARQDCPSRSHYVFHAQGEILGYYGNAFCEANNNNNSNSNMSMRGFGQRGNLRVPRQVLRKIMMDALFERSNNKDNQDADEGKDKDTDKDTSQAKSISIEWGKRLTSYTLTTMETKSNTTTATATMDDGCVKNEDDKPITLHFEDGSTAVADFLIGADGLRSTVLQKLLAIDGGMEASKHTTSSSSTSLTNNTTFTPSQESTPEFTSMPVHVSIPTSPDTTDLSYLGIMIVLGITSDFFHPLLDERGFYTLDGNHRLFTMPFEGSRIHDLEQYNTVLPCSADAGKTQHRHTRRYMWQLSFPLNLEDAKKLSKAGPKLLLEDVLTRTQRWHEPVQDMMKSTPLNTIWGTPLMDRNPTAIWKHMECFHRRQSELGAIVPIVALGDAVHSMSPFKGQGCNQALMDGPLLRKWLEGSKVTSAMKGFTRDMVQRTSKKVLASREAANYLHSMKVLEDEEDFAGIPKARVNRFLKELKTRGINANVGGQLDSEVGQVIQDLGLHSSQCKGNGNGQNNDNDNDNDNDGKILSNKNEELALKLAGSGDKLALAQIRELSIIHPASIRQARDTETGETCLHLAAKAGCYDTVKWLLTEACLPLSVLDKKGQSPLHSAVTGGNLRVTLLLARMSSHHHGGCWTKDAMGDFPLDLVASSSHDEGKRQKLYSILSIFK